MNNLTAHRVGAVREPSVRGWPLWLWLIPLLLVTFWLGTRGLDRDAMWWDEERSVWDAGGMTEGGRSVVDVWQGVAERNPWHSPGYFILLDGYARLVGWEPAILRTLALFFGVLAVAMTYRLGRDLVSPKVGLAAAFLLGTSVIYVNYLHEVRMYMQVAFLTVFTVWIYHRIVSRPRAPTIWHWVGLLVGAAGLLYTYYYGAVALIVIDVYHLFFVRKDRRWWIVTGIMALAGLLFLPWVSVFLVGVQKTQEGGGEPATLASTLDTLRSLAEGLANGSLILFAVAGIAALNVRRKGARWVWFFALVGLLILVALQIALQLKHADRLRYSISIWPMWALVLALGLVWLWAWRVRGRPVGRWIALVLIGAWLALGIDLSAYDLTYIHTIIERVETDFPLQRVARSVEAAADPTDMLVLFFEDTPLISSRHLYLSRITRFYMRNSTVASFVPSAYHDASADNADYQRLVSALDGRQRVWVAYEPDKPSPLLSAFQSAVGQDYAVCQPLTDLPDVRVEQYTISAACCIDQQNLAAPKLRFGTGIGLANIETVQTGGTLEISALWSLAADVPLHKYSASWQLLNAAGEKVAQADYGLEPLPHPCHQAGIDVTNLPSGDYQLHLTVYAWETGERLAGVVASTHQTGDLLPVTPVTLY